MNTSESKIVKTETPAGVFFVDVSQDAKMGSVLMRGVHPNSALVALAKTYTTQTSVVVDIGAHIGTFSIPMAPAVAQVIAFEPSSDTFSVLEKNCSANMAAIDIRNKGLGAAVGRASLVGRNDSNAGAQTLGAGDAIEVSTLDLEVEHADFIKIDVEGMELEVLQGGERLVRTSTPMVFFELNLSQLRAHHASPRQLEKFFTQLGYALYLPIEQKEGVFTLARVRNMTLMTACIAPRAWMFRGESAPFDIFAVPKSYTVAHAGFFSALLFAVGVNLRVKLNRLRKLFTK